MESFRQGYRLQDGDLETSFYTQGLTYPPGLAQLYSPYWVRYEIAYHHPTELRWLRIGPQYRNPEQEKTGVYRANFIVGDRWATGDYRITWHYRISEVSDIESKSEEFEIVSAGVENPVLEILFCQRNLGARVLVLQEAFDLPAGFTILPSYQDLPAEFTIIP